MEIIALSVKNLQQLYTSPIAIGLGVFVIIAAYIDFKYLKIPNKLNAAIAIVNSSYFIAYPLIFGDASSRFESLVHLGSGVFGFLLFLSIAMGTGFKMAGDIKFIGAFGIALGWGILPFIGLSCVINVMTNLTIIRIKKLDLTNIVPFAPFFAVSYILLGVFVYLI